MNLSRIRGVSWIYSRKVQGLWPIVLVMFFLIKFLSVNLNSPTARSLPFIDFDYDVPVDLHVILYPGYSSKKNISPTKLLLVGVLCTAEDFERRALIRNTYLKFKPDSTDYAFIIGKPRSWQLMTLLEYENKHYGDIMVLNTRENMNDGKTVKFFEAIYKTQHLRNGYMFVLKSDIDTMLNLPALQKKFSNFEKDIRQNKTTPNIYFGRYIRDEPGAYFMGMGYALSMDLVEGIFSKDNWCVQNCVGHEDGVMGTCVKHWDDNRNLVSWIAGSPLEFFDDPQSGMPWSQDYNEHMLVVHQLKRSDHFINAFAELLHRRFLK